MIRLDDAINEGIRCGIENAAYERCSGRDDPEDRCPMNPKHGCLCVWKAYCELPWWKRLFRSKPIRPDEKHAFGAIIADWRHQREARRIIRGIMAQDRRQRADDRRRARG